MPFLSKQMVQLNSMSCSQYVSSWKKQEEEEEEEEEEFFYFESSWYAEQGASPQSMWVDSITAK